MFNVTLKPFPTEDSCGVKEGFGANGIKRGLVLNLLRQQAVPDWVLSQVPMVASGSEVPESSVTNGRSVRTTSELPNHLEKEKWLQLLFFKSLSLEIASRISLLLPPCLLPPPTHTFPCSLCLHLFMATFTHTCEPCGPSYTVDKLPSGPWAVHQAVRSHRWLPAGS